MSLVGIKEHCRSEVSTSLKNVFSLQKRKSGRHFPRLSSIFQKLQLKNSCSGDENKNSIHHILCNGGRHSESEKISTKTLASGISTFEVKNINNNYTLSENTMVSKNIHPLKENMHGNSNSTQIFIDNKTVPSYQDNMSRVNNNGKHTGTDKKQLENLKKLRKAPPVPPLPSVLMCKGNKSIASTSSTEKSYSDSYFQCASAGNVAVINTSSMNGCKNSTNVVNQPNNKHLGTKTNRQTTRTVKRPAPKPPLRPSVNKSSQRNDCYERSSSSGNHNEKQIFSQIEGLGKHECHLGTNREDKTIHCLTNESADRCPLISTSLQSPPELPAKTVSHDTKVLFGYSVERQTAAGNLHGSTEIGCDYFETQDYSIPATTVLPQCTLVLSGRTPLARENNTANSKIMSRDMFYKSLSLRNRKKSNSQSSRGKTQLKTCIDKENCHLPFLCSAVENNAHLHTCNKNYHDSIQAEAGSIVSSVNFPSAVGRCFTGSTNDMNCIKSSQALLQQLSETTPSQENVSVPFVNEKCETVSYCEICHLESECKSVKERTDQDSNSSESTSSNSSHALPQSISNLKQDDSADCLEYITSTEGKASDEMDTNIIKETEETSTYNCIADLSSQGELSDFPSVLESVYKSNSDVRKTENDEIKYSQEDNKPFTSKMDLDSHSVNVVKDDKKQAEWHLTDMLGCTPQITAHCSNLNDKSVAQMDCKEESIDQRDILESNVTVKETCPDLHDAAFKLYGGAKFIPTLVEIDEGKISIFHKSNYDKISSQQNTSDVENSFSAVISERVKELREKENLSEEKLFQSELHPFSSESNSPHISNKSGVNSQNRSNKICPVAKSPRPLQETSALTSSQQTSTTSEVSTLCKLGPSVIYNQAIFLPTGTMSYQQLNITMLFRQLEAAIANGHHKKAAILARELALHKVACTLTSFNIHEQSPEENPITINLYIEDKNLHQGPFPLLVHCTMTLGALKVKLEKEFSLPKKLQRWILGKRLATDDNTTLKDYGVTETGCSVFLYLICSDSSENHSNNLLKKLSEISRDESPVETNSLDDANFHIGIKDINSLKVTSDSETIAETGNISEHEYASDSEDSYSYNSDLPPVSAIDNNAVDSEVDQLENQRDALADYSVSDYEESEADNRSVSEHSSSSDFVMISDNFPEQEGDEISNDKLSDNEINANCVNIHETCANNGKAVNLVEGNVHSCIHISTILPVNNGVNNEEKETKNFSNTSHIPNKNEKQEVGDLNNYILDDENAKNNYNTDKGRANEETEVYFSAGVSEYFSPVSEKPTSGNTDLLRPEISVIFPHSSNQQWTELVKHEELEGKEVSGHQFHEMEYVAVKNELDSRIKHVDHHKVDEVKIPPDTMFIMPTAKQKIEVLHNSKNLQTDKTNIQHSKAFEREQKFEQNEAEKQEVEIEQEQHGYLPDMEFLAVINEFHNEIEEMPKENMVEPYNFVNYAIPTTIELKEQKLEDVCNAPAIEIWVPVTSAVGSKEENLVQSDSVACMSCGSLYALDGRCESCKSETNVENAVDKANTSQTVNPEMVQGSTDDDKEMNNYQFLMQLDNQDLIPNAEPFWCPVCFTDIQERQGVVLRDCLHQFCKECLAGTVEHSETTIIKCPFRNEEYSCESHLQEREIKAVVTNDIFERYLHRGVMAAEGRADNSFHCKMPDCRGWCILDNPTGTFQCPTCSHINCLQCKAVHEGLACQQYQEELAYRLSRDSEVQETKHYLDNMVKEGKAMLCPKCDAFVIKRWGCDWLKCSVCQTEICWVTKKARWGPGGHGDTSDGCQCGVNGQRCHPKCNYCH